MTLKNENTDPFFQGVPTITGDTNDDLMPFGVEDFASMSMGMVYVIDFLKRNFRFVADRSSFLCGYSAKEVLLLGYDFYSIIIHPEELPLFKKIHTAILQRLHSMTDLGNVRHFSFVVRFKHEIGYLAVHHRLKPMFINGQIRYGLCLLTSSIIDTPGHLRIYYNNSINFEEYSMEDEKWKKREIPLLTVREKEVLKLVKQGRTGKEAANALGISYNTLRNIKTTIFQKLDVTSMTQAIIYANYSQLLFSNGYLDECTEEPTI